MNALAESWHAALHRLQREGVPHVLASVLTSQGSTPREPGARMVITAKDCFDTLGGGTFEWQVIELARCSLAERRFGLRLEAFSLGARSGQCCGGGINVLLEAFPGAETEIALFGAGHVAHAFVALATPLSWRIRWYDSRPHAFTDTDGADRLTCHLLNDVNDAVSQLAPGVHALIMTHCHDEDYALCKALLQRDDLASIGLIGSASKRASFKARLHREAPSLEFEARIRCPIGHIAGQKLEDKRPYAIALTAVAELLQRVTTPRTRETRGLESEALRAIFTSINTHEPL
ncbi:xanthine dehydrogenase accessory protein XdhC [Halomonas dongshanensis]|uniref:Xanthine dehydrogenase accessory protein XdhC n=1 Tax=Halomonas dongshanensis TaxID=2890835 RepID=A0ABT2EG14_9GAMM|nr:xanthine dehydrogenase accessory protein XdhC [Halomonas dongshanensis]MCS2610510.1 xanthine dehydrogenase accessory protein XdhC [Halomonas dongshanensis]